MLKIRFGIMKQFVRALDKESTTFKRIEDYSHRLSEQRSKLVSLSDHRYRRSRSAKNFLVSSLGGTKRLGTALSQWAITRFKDYAELVETLVKNYRKMRAAGSRFA